MPRDLSIIAAEIRKDWKNIHYATLPYLQAITTLQKVSDNCYLDSGKSIILYFLSNAQTWKGETARKIKTELKQMLNSSLLINQLLRKYYDYN